MGWREYKSGWVNSSPGLRRWGPSPRGSQYVGTLVSAVPAAVTLVPGTLDQSAAVVTGAAERLTVIGTAALDQAASVVTGAT